jgi:hypothetical protein
MRNLVFLVLVVLMAATPAAGLATSYSISPTADTQVQAFQPNYNYGADQSFWVNWGGTSGNAKGRSFLRFDLSSIPDTYQITQAVLHLYHYTNSGSVNNVVDVHYVSNDSWKETGSGAITWNNAPAYGAKLGAQTIPKSSPPGWATFNLFGVPGAWNWSADLNDNAVSLMLKFDNESQSQDIMFISKENIGGWPHPYLEITANPTPLPGTIFLLSSGLVGLVGWRRFKKG